MNIVAYLHFNPIYLSRDVLTHLCKYDFNHVDRPRPKNFKDRFINFNKNLRFSNVNYIYYYANLGHNNTCGQSPMINLRRFRDYEYELQKRISSQIIPDGFALKLFYSIF